MKFKTTTKALRESGQKIVSVGYLGVYYLLKYHDPIAYTCGKYGWNYDVYQIDDLFICTGYWHMPGKKAVDFRRLNEKAKHICEDPELCYEEKKAQVEEIVKIFVQAQFE